VARHVTSWWSGDLPCFKVTGDVIFPLSAVLRIPCDKWRGWGQRLDFMAFHSSRHPSGQMTLRTRKKKRRPEAESFKAAFVRGNICSAQRV
jgi:hypothetical protein